MLRVIQIREEKRKVISPATHFDKSGPLQTLSRFPSPRYHQLIEAFRGLTKNPILLIPRSIRAGGVLAKRGTGHLPTDQYGFASDGRDHITPREHE
jgi:hypothetical protein